MDDKRALLERGKGVMSKFCSINSLTEPEIVEANSDKWQFGVCAYYRRNTTTICVPRCASIGFAGMQWSYPGNTVDRTPYGVLQHELGHHVDVLMSTQKGPYFGDFSVSIRAKSGEEPITSYCPNDAEWFAEMFRLFVTNPDLLLKLRPRTHAEMMAHFKPCFDDTWQERMRGAPDRTILAVERKVEVASKPKKPPSPKREAPASTQSQLL